MFDFSQWGLNNRNRKARSLNFGMGRKSVFNIKTVRDIMRVCNKM